MHGEKWGTLLRFKQSVTINGLAAVKTTSKDDLTLVGNDLLLSWLRLIIIHVILKGRNRTQGCLADLFDFILLWRRIMD